MATATIHTLPVARVESASAFLAQSVRDNIHIVIIPPDGPPHGNQPMPYGRWFGDDAGAAAAWALTENAKGFNAYWTVNYVRGQLNKKPKKLDMAGARFLHVDIDPPKDGNMFDRAAVLEQLADYAVPPAFVIDSGNGVQALWRLDYPAENMPVVETLNQSLEDVFGGDHCYNIDRLLRLPGSVNYPNKAKRSRGRLPTLATIAVVDAGESVDPEDMRQVLPVPQAREASERAHVELGSIKPMSLADLGITPVNPLYSRIVAPKNQDRSSAVYAVACEMVRQEFSDAEIAGVLLNADLAISAHCLEQARAVRAAQRSIGAARRGAEAEPPKKKALRAESPTSGVGLGDFYAHMPTHTYIFTPSREFWPGTSVDARIPPVPLINRAGRPVLDNKGKPKSIRAAAWLDQERPIEQMTWAPGEPMIVENRLISDGGWIARPGCSCFNLYRPPMIGPGDASKAGRWVEHIRTVYPAEADHIIHWLAHRVQRPEEKINHALVLGGSQGVGKDTILEPVKAAIGPWNFAEVSPQHMLGRFNGFVKSVILRVGEARDLGEVDRFAFYDHMKTYTAAPPDVLRVDEKHLREYSVFNVSGVIITSNHKTDGIYLPADDRRHFVAWSEATRDQFAPDYWAGLYGWYAAGGTAHIAAYLRELDLTGFNAKAPPTKTEAFWAIVGANKSPEDSELADALDNLGWPAATTIQSLGSASTTSFSDFLAMRSNAKRVAHRLEDAGYVAVRNEAANDGLWRVGGRRAVIYGRKELAIRDRVSAAQALLGTRF